MAKREAKPERAAPSLKDIGELHEARKREKETQAEHAQAITDLREIESRFKRARGRPREYRPEKQKRKPGRPTTQTWHKCEQRLVWVEHFMVTENHKTFTAAARAEAEEAYKHNPPSGISLRDYVKQETRIFFQCRRKFVKMPEKTKRRR